MHQALYEHVRVKQVYPLATDSDDDYVTDSVDMSGWDGVAFELVNDGGGTFVLQVHESSDDFDVDSNEITDATATQTEDTGIVVIDVWRPLKRYVRLAVNVSNDSVVWGVTSKQYSGNHHSGQILVDDSDIGTLVKVVDTEAEDIVDT